MNNKNKYLALALSVAMLLSVFTVLSISTAEPQADDFKIVMPWPTTHERGKIIKSMVDNSSIAGKYNFIYSDVGGGPTDRLALTADFRAGNYPNLMIVTQDWYTEFSRLGLFYDFSVDIAAWSGERADWREDIPTGWWKIFDEVNGDGTGTGIQALPFFAQSTLPYFNIDHFTDVGLNATELAEDMTMVEFMAAAATLDAGGYTPMALVGAEISDLVYMNYMMGSVNDFISDRADPARVLSWGPNDEYGMNGSLNVQGFADYLKFKGEGWTKNTVDSDEGGDANDLFGLNQTSMVFVGPWGTSIFEGLGLDNFVAANMPRNADGKRSTITGGGMSMVPIKGLNTNTTMLNDAVALAQDLLDHENQMKTVTNWLDVAWRIPVRLSVTEDPWFSQFPNRTNFIRHVVSDSYAYPWGKQHPDWVNIHTDVLQPGYKAALTSVVWDQGYTDAEYLTMAQTALDNMAFDAQIFKLGYAAPVYPVPTTTAVTSVEYTTVETTSIQFTTVVERTPGFVALFGLIGLSTIILYKKRTKK